MKCDDVLSDIDIILQNPDDEAAHSRLENHFRECEECRKKHGDIINTAAKISEAGQISDIVDMSDKFIEETRKEAKKESDRYRIGTIQKKKSTAEKRMDIAIIVLLACTVIAALVIFMLAMIYL